MRNPALDIVCDLFGEEPTEEDLDAIAEALAHGAAAGDAREIPEAPVERPVTLH